MQIVVVGASHATAPVALLERISVSALDMDVALGQLKRLTSEGLILSTCNRTEIHAVLADDADAALLTDWLSGRAGEGVTSASQFYVHRGAAAVSHALRVASGLDSMVLGEDQIQAQFRRALSTARAADMLGPHLERLGAAALGCGKRVRAFTGLGRYALSLESIAADVALTTCTTAANVVVVGSGSSANVLLRYLRERNVAEIRVVGRTESRARALAESNGARFVPWETLPDAVIAADAVFCCTSAPHPVLTPAVLARRAATSTKSLICVDLGMPHDIDPAVADIEGVSVVGLEALGAVAKGRRQGRAEHVSSAEAIVAHETARFLEWLDTRDRTGEIVRVQSHADAIADAELRRALARMPNLAARDRAIIANLAHRIARKLAHQQTDAIKYADIDFLAEQA